MLDKMPAKEQVLRCGGHEALSPEVNRRWIREEFTPGVICDNCSAKHIGMYAARTRPGRRWSCGLPSPYAPDTRESRSDFPRAKRAAARRDPMGCQRMQLPGTSPPAAGHWVSLRQGCRRGGCRRAGRTRGAIKTFGANIQRHVEAFRYGGQFCTALMSQFQSGLIGKLGADGCYGVAVRQSEQTRRLGAQGAVGIAVKIEDGSIEILYAAVMEILHQLDIGISEQRQSLCAFHYPARPNTAGETTGRVTFDLKVWPESTILPN